MKFKMIHYVLCLALLLVMTGGLAGAQAVLAQEEEAPVVDFIASPTSAVAPLEVEFSAQSEGTITGWLWDFGDGQTSKEKNPLHEYTTPGKYTVSLTVTGPEGTDTKTRRDYITVSEEKLELETKFPVVSGEASGIFETEVDVKYQGKERRRIDLTFTTPKDWNAMAESSYPKKQIAAIELGPAERFAVTEKITVTFAPVYWYLPEPGDYKVTLEVTAGELKETIELTAKVTAKYEFDITTVTGRLNTEATAGDDKHFSIVLVNTGSVPIEDVSFTTNKPEGWSVKFEPEKVDSVEPGFTQDVDVIINAPKGKTIAGDYVVGINANSKKVNDNIELRVTVLTSPIWGWVGIAIVVVVILGLAVIFRQLGRR